MNPLSPPEKDLNLHVLLDQTETGRVTGAMIAEISGCQVEAATREEALLALQQLLKRLPEKTEIIPFALSLESPDRENPWTEFIGMFEGDAEFDEIAAELRQERE
jgi:hypothetical protein